MRAIDYSNTLKCVEVGLLLIRSEVLGNESSENRKRYRSLNNDLKYSQCHWKQWNNMSKSIADRADFGSILMDVTEEDIKHLELLNSGFPMPNIKLSVYKNRRGAFTKFYLWMNADKSTCRYRAMFATDYQYRPLVINDTVIKVVK